MSQQDSQSEGEDSGAKPATATGCLLASKVISVITAIAFAGTLYYTIPALRDQPRYHQDCAAASASPGQTSPTQPCVYKPATLTLENRTHRRRQTGLNYVAAQYANLRFADGTHASVLIGGGSEALFTKAQINGPCRVELWRGKVTSIFSTGHAIQTGDNPDQGADSSARSVLLGLFVFTVAPWITLRKPSREARARRKRRDSTY